MTKITTEKYSLVIFRFMNGQCDRCGCDATALCSGCMKIYYCSATCHREAWHDGHKAVCELLSPPSDDEKAGFIKWLQTTSRCTVTDVVNCEDVITPDLCVKLEDLGYLSRIRAGSVQLHRLLSLVVPTPGAPFGIVRMNSELFALVFTFYTLKRHGADYIRFTFPLSDAIRQPAGSDDLYYSSVKFVTTSYMLLYRHERSSRYNEEMMPLSFTGQWIVKHQPQSCWWGLTSRGLRVSSGSVMLPGVTRWIETQVAQHTRLAKHRNSTAKIICELDPDLRKLREEYGSMFHAILSRMQKFIAENPGNDIKGILV